MTVKSKRPILVFLLLFVLLMASAGCGRASAEPGPTRHDNKVPVKNNLQTKKAALQVATAKTGGSGSKTAVNKVTQGQKTVTSAPKVSSPPRSQTPFTTVYVSASGEGRTFFCQAKLPIKPEDTVFSATKTAAARSGVEIKWEGTGLTAYVSGIGGLMEFDRGPMSGWLYRVNGQYPGVGCGMYRLKGGEKVEWIYTTNGRPEN